MAYFVYILTNRSNTLYVGSTKNLQNRLKQHIRGKSPHFTAKYNLNKLIYYKKFEDSTNAYSMEKKIKGWTRKKKMELIKNLNPGFIELTIKDEINSEILH